MKFEWLKDEVKGNYLLCLAGYRSLFFRGTLSPEDNGKLCWQPFPKGEPREIHGDLATAQRYCETMCLIAKHNPNSQG